MKQHKYSIMLNVTCISHISCTSLAIYSPTSPVWSKLSPFPLLICICFTHNRAPGLLTFHANKIVNNLYGLVSKCTADWYYKIGIERRAALKAGKAKRNNCLARVHIGRKSGKKADVRIENM